LFTFESGASYQGYLQLYPRGDRLQITGFDADLVAKRGHPLPDNAAGSFLGHYKSDASHDLQLALQQWGDLLAGTGFYSGKPVAVAGKVVSPNHADGHILFSDGSKANVKAVLSADQQVLSISGLGKPFDLHR
jgi:hypothetical protein